MLVGNPPKKKLILLFDGTWNSAALGTSRDITNIYKINVALKTHDENGIPQIIHYYPGPGSRGFIDKELGGIFGNGIDQIIKEAYVNLSSNYCAGDDIYIFGFSRGAIAARALTGLLSKCGLLRSENINRLWRVWKYFLNLSPTDADLRERDAKITPFVRSDLKVEFLGLFDAVIGRPFNEANRFSKLRFENNKIDRNVAVGIHILAIDDRRTRYKPLLWDEKNDDQLVEQIWMPGVHSDIGGVGKTNFTEIVSFLTMIDRILKYTDLSLEEFVLNNMISRLYAASDITISNELSSLTMKFLQRSRRSVSDADINQYKSAFFDGIYGEKIMHRGVLKKYKLSHHDKFMKLKNIETIYDKSIAIVSEEIVQDNI